MPLVVPGVCQFTIHGTYGGRPVANVLAYQIDTTGAFEERQDACEAFAGILINEWSDSILPGVGSLYNATKVTWVDLNSATGSVGERATTTQETWPQNGTQALSCMPGNVAMLVRKSLVAQRGARMGRMYLVGVPESWTDTTEINKITSGNVAAANTRLAAFLGDTNQTGPTGVFDYSAHMVVVHITERADPEPGQEVGSPIAGIGMRVNSLTMDQTLATQRRRLRG